MIEKEAWIFLSEIWEFRITHNFVGTCVYLPTIGSKGYNAAHGICECITNLYYNHKINIDVAQKMYSKIRRAQDILIERGIKSVYGDFIWDLTEDGAIERSDFCKEMAVRCA